MCVEDILKYDSKLVRSIYTNVSRLIKKQNDREVAGQWKKTKWQLHLITIIICHELDLDRPVLAYLARNPLDIMSANLS
jgi:hypothetical protein